MLFTIYKKKTSRNDERNMTMLNLKFAGLLSDNSMRITRVVNSLSKALQAFKDINLPCFLKQELQQQKLLCLTLSRNKKQKKIIEIPSDYNPFLLFLFVL